MFNRDFITSSSNNTIKYILKLHQKKYRKQYNRYIVEGLKAVAEAVSEGAGIELIAFSDKCPDSFMELYNTAVKSGVNCITIAHKLFSRLTDTQTPEGVLAVVEQKIYDPGLILGKESCFILILDGIRDPGNLGTIIRTMDAAGGDGIILTNNCVDPYNLKAVRSTMGSILRIPVIALEEDELLAALKEYGYHIAVRSLKGKNIFDWHCDSPRIAAVIGSESHGVGDWITDMADSHITIPMYGRAESLNASVASGVIIYDIVRKRFN